MEHIISAVDEKRALLEETADFLWEHPETAFTEFQSAAYLCNVLRQEGFSVEENLAGIATAFSGTYGSGKPVIGILGEFDALSGLSQQGCTTEQVSAGGEAGHGCGHNLLGTGSLGAAIAVKEWLKATGHPGTVIYFGCPGEEGGSGKAFMARDGVFDGLDAAFCWHPSDNTKVRTCLSLANYQVLYKFDGVASHAGGKPHLGRSALDAVELMNVGVQFLREHIPSSCRIHYAITDTGGFSPNVVQPHAEVLYLIRGVDNKTVAELYDRVNDIAKGAALMTGTKENHQFIKACSNTITNEPMQYMLQEKMEAISAPAPTEEDEAFAREITTKSLTHVPTADPEHPLWWETAPYTPEKQEFGSTDVGDVSWVCPTAQIHTACNAKGTPGHSWQETSQAKTTFAKKMTVYAAKILAAGAVEMMTNPDLLEQAKADHRKRVGPEGYQAPIPQGVRPISMDDLRK